MIIHCAVCHTHCKLFHAALVYTDIRTYILYWGHTSHQWKLNTRHCMYYVCMYREPSTVLSIQHDYSHDRYHVQTCYNCISGSVYHVAIPLSVFSDQLNLTAETTKKIRFQKSTSEVKSWKLKSQSKINFQKSKSSSKSRNPEIQMTH